MSWFVEVEWNRGGGEVTKPEEAPVAMSVLVRVVIVRIVCASGV